MSTRLERCYAELPMPNVAGPHIQNGYDYSKPPALPPKIAQLPLPTPPPLPPLPPPPNSAVQQTTGGGARCGPGTSFYGNNVSSGMCECQHNSKNSTGGNHDSIISLPSPMPILMNPNGNQSPPSSASPTSQNSGRLCLESGSSSIGHNSWINNAIDEMILPSSILPQSQAPSTVGSSRGASLMDTKASALLDSHDRFKPEKTQRRPVQKMKWGQSRWSRSLAGDLFTCLPPATAAATIGGNGYGMCNNTVNVSGGNHMVSGHTTGTYGILGIPSPTLLESESRVSSMTIADVSPRLAVKKVLLLYEHAQYREAANFIHRLSIGTFRIILRELPLDIFVEAMPHSLPIMEALYTKVFASDGPGVSLKVLRPEVIVMHMVKFFSREEMVREMRNRRESLGPFTIGCKKILQVIVLAEPKMIKTIQQRRRTLDKAVEGMGQHGLVGTTDESLLPLHDALKLEFRRVVDTYKGALQKLEDLALAAKNNPKSVVHGPAPIQASHQRQLSLKAEEIQDRLIKNKSLLNVVEPTLDNNCLDILLGILQRRIDCDKEALFQFTQLRKEAGDITYESIVAPLLMRYSRGCKQVLEMMREVAHEAGGIDENYDDDSSDLSGYHSDSDSAIMTSGNSPYISPRARYNFISRSVRSKAILRPSIMFNSASAVSSSSSSGVSCLDSSRSGSGFSGVSSSCLNDSPPPLPPTNTGASKAKTGAPTSATTGVNETEVCECSHSLNNNNGKSSSSVSNNNNCSNFSQCNKTAKGSIITKPASGSSATPIRPRHVKAKNQLHKNNSLVSTSSSGGSDSSGSSLQEAEFALGECCHGHGAQQVSSTGCIDCVTLVSVPDNHVITQGVNHHCTAIVKAGNNGNTVAGGLPTAVSSPSDNNHNQSHNTNNSDKEQLILDLQSEINQLRRGLANANTTINHLQIREKKFLISATRAHATENGHAHHAADNGNGKSVVRHHAPILNSMRDREDRRAQWVHEYGALYAQARVETMDALDALPYLANADELKSKLLYSVVVLSFRAVQSHVSDIKRQIQSLLRMNQPNSTATNYNHYKQSHHQHQMIPYHNSPIKNGDPNQKPINSLLLSPLQARVLEAMNDYLQYSGHMFDLARCVEQVGNQLWTTLSDYPRLKKCEGLMNYIKSCVNLAWGLTNQTPSCVLEYETKVFMREMHVRFHSSDQNSENIKAYLWPALLEGPNGACIHKGVVIT